MTKGCRKPARWRALWAEGWGAAWYCDDHKEEGRKLTGFVKLTRVALLLVVVALGACSPSCVVYQHQEQHTCPEVPRG